MPQDLLAFPCPLCGRPGGGVVIRENGFEARRCDDCGLVFVSPRPPPSRILGIYEHDESQTRARQHIGKNRTFFALAHARHTLRILGCHASGGSLLELGAGGGLFLQEARKAGFDVRAIEPNTVLAAFIRDDLGIPCESVPISEASFGGQTFDVIYHCNVLSHFYDPVQVFHTLHGRLRPGGLLLLETGNYADVDPRYHATIARTERFQLPEHLAFFGERSLLALLERTAFRPLAIHRYSRVAEKLLQHRSERLRFFLRYRLGRWLLKSGRPQTMIVVAQS